MTGKSEESEAGGDWLAPLFEQLKGAVQRAAAVLAKDDPEEKADAETLARRAGVVARAALAVDAIRRRMEAERRAEKDSEKDEMGGRTDRPEEKARLQRRLLLHCERMDRILETKGAGPDGRARTEADGAGDGAAPPPVPAPE